jgi:hypothetical protein
MTTPMTSLRRRAVLAMAVSAAAFGGAARAQSFAPLVDLQVVDRETGQVMQVWRHDGRLFVAGQPGARYSLRVTNNTDGRVLAVMSVDGVNVISGETAGYGQTGYVLRPRESYDVSGWRKSDSEVAAFTFAPQSQSYAARTGRPLDVGVIGLAVFRERVVLAPTPIAPLAAPLMAPRAAPPASANRVEEEVVVTGQRSGRAAPAPPPPARAAAAQPAPPAADIVTAERRTEKLGTGHGAREWSFVTNVNFERATPYPQLIQRIEYDTYENLVAANVIPRPWQRGRPPRAFPRDGDGPRYVPDPPGGG